MFWTQRAKRTIGIATIVICAIELLIARQIWQQRQERLAEGYKQARQVSLLLSEKTRDAFTSADLVLLNIKTWLERGNSVVTNDVELQNFLQSKVNELGHARAFFVIGPDGFIIHDTDYPATPRVSLGDREYFAVHRQDHVAGIHVGKPLHSRSIDAWFVPVSRRIERNGVFLGVAVAAIEPKFFEEFFRTIDLGERDAISVFNADGTLIARFPQMNSEIGQQFSQLSLFTSRLRESTAGTFVSDAFNHDRALIGYRKIDSLPLVASVALNESSLLAGWRYASIAWVIAGLVIPLLIALWLVTRHRYYVEQEAYLQRSIRSQKIETLGQMTAGVVHDFKNILSVLAASLWLARKHGADEQHIATGELALERGERLTAQLLNFVKRQELDFSIEDVNNLLRSVEPIIQQASGATVRVSLELDPAISPCLVDRGQFDAAIVNLVMNATHAMSEGLISISTTEMSVDDRKGGLPSGRYVAVRIADNGSGIPAAELKHVFDPFYTTKNSGTGLGLAQVLSFMHNVGGDARIESELAVGTTVTLLFPCRDRREVAATTANAGAGSAGIEKLSVATFPSGAPGASSRF